jgi:hypothetical protein
VASVVLVVFAGFVAHLCLLGSHLSQLTTKEEMDIVESNPTISDERMDVDSSNNNEQLQLLPQEENTARGLPFPHTEDSNGQHTIQYISMCVLFYFLPPSSPNLIPSRNSGTLNKGQLANLCQIFGLKRSGNKPALVERLHEFSSNRDLWEG